MLTYIGARQRERITFSFFSQKTRGRKNFPFSRCVRPPVVPPRRLPLPLPRVRGKYETKLNIKSTHTLRPKLPEREEPPAPGLGGPFHFMK